MTIKVLTAAQQLERYPKNVIIEALLYESVLGKCDRIIRKCEEIHSDKQFKALMARGEELDKQTKILLVSQPQLQDWESYAVWLDKIQKINEEQGRIQTKIDKLLDWK